MTSEQGSRRSSTAVVVAAIAAFVLAFAIGAFAVVAARSGGESPTTSPADPTPAPTPSVSEASTPTPTPTPVPSVSEPPLPTPPADQAGGLTSKTLPTAKALGAGWKFRVDPGSTEDGYVTNGTPTLERDPAEVLQTSVPLGCESRTTAMLARHALETDYLHTPSGTSGVGLRLRFASAADAATYVSERSADLTACAAQQPGEYDHGVHLVAGLTLDEGLVAFVRHDPWLEGDAGTWTEVMAWDGGRDVVLLAANGEPGDAGIDDDRLAAAASGVLA